MLKSIIIRRVVAVAIPFVVSSVIPFLVADRPVIKWTWDNFGPVIVDAVQDRGDDLVD